MIRISSLIFTIFCLILLSLPSAQAGKLAIVIDDFGYRKSIEEQIILLSTEITVSILPNSPNAEKIAFYAHEQGNDIMIHLPMAPISKQYLEKDTLTPDMSQEEIQRIISEAILKVPYAIGLNNHMGSKMTTNVEGMRKVMESLLNYPLFFLDSRTIAQSKAMAIAREYRIPAIRRDIFLDDLKDEKSIMIQFDLAIELARKHKQAIVIGHPYFATLNVLQQKLAQLPDDIELVKLSSLIDNSID